MTEMNAIAPDTVAKAFSLFVPLTKRDDEKRMVYGYASTEAIDSDGEVISREAIQGALPGYMKFGNIREMHQLSAVGVTKETEIDDKGLYIGAKIVDDDAWNKVKEGVYKGFSIGGRATERVGKKITKLDLIEISLVDRPANPEALIEVFKAQQTEGSTSMATASDQTTEQAVAENRAKLTKAIEALSPDALAQAVAAFEKRAKQPEVKEETPPPPIEKAEEPPQEEEPKKPDFDVDHYAIMLKSMQLGAMKINSVEELASLLSIQPEQVPQVIDRCDELLRAERAEVQKQEKVEEKPEETKGGNEPGDGEKPYGDVPYADPGYQADGKKRYPIDTEAHIRAAWNYINKPKNAGKYSPQHASAIRSRIIGAWKKHIDSEGPPEAQGKKDEKAVTPSLSKADREAALSKLGKADASVSLKKGVYAASHALQLLYDLNCLHEGIEREAAVEDDGSTMPDRFKSLVQTMAELVQALVEEEIEEMLTNKETQDLAMGNYPILFSAKPEVQKAAADLIRKSIGDKTGEDGWLAMDALADALDANAEKMEKAGKTPAQTQEYGNGQQTPGNATTDSNDHWERVGHISKAAQEIMDHCSKITEKIGKAKEEPPKDEERNPPPKEDDGDEDDKAKKKAEGEEKPEEKAKAATSNPPPAAPSQDVAILTEAIAGLADMVKGLQAEVSSGRRNPPMPKGALKTVNKADDHVAAGSQSNETTSPADVLKSIHANPNFLSRNGG